MLKTYFKESESSDTVLSEEKIYVEGTSYSVTTRNYISSTSYKGKIEKYNYLNKMVSLQTETNIDNYTYLANGLLSIEKTANSSATYYYYNKTNRLDRMYKQTTATEYAATFYVYDNFGRLIEEKIGNEKVALNSTPLTFTTTTYTYDSVGRVITKATSSGEYITYLYDEFNNVIKETTKINSEQNKVKQYEYNYLNKVAKDKEEDIIITYQYDGIGNITKEVRGNRVSEYTYDKLGNLVKKKLNGSIEEELFYDNMSNVTKSIDANGNATTYIYDKQNNKVKETNAKSLSTEYTYDLVGRVLTVKNPIGTTTVYTYDKFDNVLQKTIADEIIYKYTYDKNHNLLQATDPELNVTTYVYDNLDNLVNVTDARSGVTSYVYNAKSQLIQETNAKNQVTIYRYDESGNLINKGIKATATGTEVIVEQNTYDLLNNLVTKKDGNLNTTTYNYNNKGQLIKITNPLGYIQEFTYNIFGEVIKINDNLEKEIIKEYDIKGNITKEIKQKTDESESIQIIKEYDKNNNVTKEIDGNVNITLYFYDNLNNLTKIKNPKGQETTYIYDSNNNLIKETNYLEDFKSYSYDKHDRLIETRNELDEIIEKKEYDKNSRQVKSIDANGYVYTYVYGKTGNLYQKIDELGGTYLEKYDCDLLNNIITKTDKKGNITNYEYDQFQNLVKVTNALNEVTTYEYDNNGNLIKVKDGRGKISEYTYDALNNELTEKDALGNIEYKEYSINGLLNKRITRKEDIINYTYDIHGRLIEENDISYIYDNNSNLTEVTELDKEIIRTYDELDRVITKLEDGLLSRYSYDINGYKEKSIDPLGNEVIKVYDKVGRLIKVNEEVEYTYNADGTLKKLVYANGASEEYFYNQDKTLNKLININGEDTQEYKYEYDTYKNIIKEISPSGTVINTYDALNRLKTVTRNGSTTTYTYDASGNRTKEVTGTKTKDYIYSSTNVLNQITEKNSSVVTQIITYDNDTNGNQVKEYVNSVLTRTNTYNYKNELIGMTKENTTTNYEYNAEGKRVSKNSGIDTIKFIYEGTKVILELDGNNDKIATNIYGQALLKRTTVDYSGYYLYNGHGDVVTIIDEENEVLDSYEYDAWGNLISNEITSIESRNLFDKNNSSQIVSLFTHSGSTTLVANNTVKSVFTPCEPNTQYTVSKLSGARFTVSTVAQVPTAGLTRTLLAENNSATTLTVTTPSNAKYLIVYVYVSTGDTLSLEEILGSIQIELGPVATEYEPYGIMEIINNTTEGINNPYRYSGYYYDEETDNYYLMARYYNPVIARFISEDTYRGEYRDPLSLNRYVYVNNNPLIYYDPSGYFLEGVWDWYKYRVDKTVDGLHQIGGPLEYIGLRVVGITDGVFEGIYGLGNLVEAEVNTVGALLDFGITELAYQTGMMDDKTRLDRFEKIDKTLNKSYKTLSTIPQMPGAMLNTIGTTINPVNIVKYLDPNTTDYEFLKKQGTATVGTALLAKGIVDGVKSIQWSSNTLTIPTGAPNIDGSIPAVTVTYPTIAGVDTASMNQALIKAGTGLSSISGGNIGDKQRKGTPKNNQVQNKQVDDIVKKYKLSKAQRRILHDEISGQNLTFKEIESIAIEIINGNY